jgi:16S rRNA (cytosine1402-N4)-methyltransferase
MEMTRHTSVLLEETIKNLHLEKGKIAVDATLGGGGHALAIFERIMPGGRLIAFDADADAISRFRARVAEMPLVEGALKEGALLPIKANYSRIGEMLDAEGIVGVDAIMADLGFSSDQIESAERGFSFRNDGPLDMRLDRSTDLTAKSIVNTYDEHALRRILEIYGNEPEARRIARAIVSKRESALIETTEALRSIIEAVYPAARKHQGIHPATRSFQALRIVVNREYDHLESFLAQAVERLNHGGRLAVITFHSGEDRIVKQFMKERSVGCICPPEFPVCRCGKSVLMRIVTKKPIVPGESEIASNPRSRSAKLRVIEKL